MMLNQLLETVETLRVKGPDSIEIKGLANDSRKIAPGWVFIAVTGMEKDGADYITEAVSKGAVAVVSESELELGSQVTHIQVSNARRALAELAGAYYGHLAQALKMIGVTGTNGKTTTTYMIREILQGGGFLSGLLGTVAYEVGERSIPSPRTTPEIHDIYSMLQQMKEAGCDAAVLEVSSHAIDLQRVHGIDFDIGVFTNLTQDHLDYHKDMETYFEVKSRLFEALEKGEGRAAIVNLDDPWGKKLIGNKKIKPEILTCGFCEEAAVRASEASVSAKGTTFKVTTPWGDARIFLHLLGRFNIHNALSALAVGGLCGIDLARMILTLESIKAIPGRLELVSNRKGRKVFVDYAHTDDALKNVLATLREICKGKLLLVFGCGGNRDQGKRLKMGRVAAEFSDYSMVTSDNPRDEDPGRIVGEIIEGFSEQDKFKVELDRRKAIQKAIKHMKRNDILIIAGKGHETYQELKGTIVPFDDREIVRELTG